MIPYLPHILPLSAIRSNWIIMDDKRTFLAIALAIAVLLAWTPLAEHMGWIQPPAAPRSHSGSHARARSGGADGCRARVFPACVHAFGRYRRQGGNPALFRRHLLRRRHPPLLYAEALRRNHQGRFPQGEPHFAGSVPDRAPRPDRQRPALVEHRPVVVPGFRPEPQGRGTGQPDLHRPRRRRARHRVHSSTPTIIF